MNSEQEAPAKTKEVLFEAAYGYGCCPKCGATTRLSKDPDAPVHLDTLRVVPGAYLWGGYKFPDRAPEHKCIGDPPRFESWRESL